MPLADAWSDRHHALATIVAIRYWSQICHVSVASYDAFSGSTER